MQRKGELACVAVAIVLLWFPLKNHFDHQRKIARSQSCQNNLKRLAVSLMIYTNAYDGCYPLVAATNPTSRRIPPFGWLVALQPYIVNSPFNYCPSVPRAEDWSLYDNYDKPDQSGFTDYWFNRNLGGAIYAKLSFPSRIILAGDGNDGIENTNAHFNRQDLPPNYAPARR
ncbi:MAG TPA: DUF1559 domain-containing protein, partial [Abditibacteriaceae bacterium]